MVSCETRDEWLRTLEESLGMVMKTGPTGVTSTARTIESLAEALEIIQKMPCGKFGTTSFGEYPVRKPVPLGTRTLKEIEEFYRGRTLQEICEEAARLFAEGYDANLRILRAKYPDLVKEFEDQRQAVIDRARQDCVQTGGKIVSMQLPMFAQGEVGAAIGGVVAPALVTAALAPTPAAPLIPIAAPLAAAAGAEAGRRVETQVIPAAGQAIGAALGSLRGEYGALAQYGAVFTGREKASHLARTYQAGGIPSFVYFDPSVPQVDVEASRKAGVTVQKFDPETKQPILGMWRVEIGEPSPPERALAREIRVIHPSAEIPLDPKHRIFLEFPPAREFGAIVERPTLLDALVDAERGEMGGFVTPAAAPKAPCDCASLPGGKELCTREGVIGILSQVQVRDLCSERRPLANGRIARAQALREAQTICGTLVEGIPDTGQRFGARFTCLSEVLKGRGVQP